MLDNLWKDAYIIHVWFTSLLPLWGCFENRPRGWYRKINVFHAWTATAKTKKLFIPLSHVYAFSVEDYHAICALISFQALTDNHSVSLPPSSFLFFNKILPLKCCRCTVILHLWSHLYITIGATILLCISPKAFLHGCYSICALTHVCNRSTMY
jgi:hypothetical protein